MKERMGQIKEFVGKLSSKTKKLIIAGAALLLIAAVAIAFVLNNKPYEVLFYGLGPDEAQQIVEKLQAEEIPFKFKNDSTILVEKQTLWTRQKQSLFRKVIRRMDLPIIHILTMRV